MQVVISLTSTITQGITDGDSNSYIHSTDCSPHSICTHFHSPLILNGGIDQSHCSLCAFIMS